MNSDELSRWQTLAIGDVADVVGGGTPSTRVAENFDGGIPWITPKDLAQHEAREISRGERNITDAGLASSSARMLPKGAVLLSSRAPIGYVAIAARPVSTNQGFRSLVMKDGNVAEFFYYLLKANKPLLESRANGSTFREISGTSLKGITLDVPPPEEQQRIAWTLGTLDNKIENNWRLAKTLEEIAATLFKARFIDFVGHDDLVESEIGLIPRGWSVTDIYEVASVTYGRPFKSSLFSDSSGIPLLRIRDLVTQEPQICTTEHREDGRLIKAGDIVVGMDGEFRAHIWSGLDSWLNQRVCVFDPLAGISRAFVLGAIKQPLAFFEATKSGTTVIHLGKRDIDRFRIVLPPSAVMSAFCKEADPLLLSVVAARKQARTLATVRDVLLPRLVSGQIRVSPEMQFAPEAA